MLLPVEAELFKKKNQVCLNQPEYSFESDTLVNKMILDFRVVSMLMNTMF